MAARRRLTRALAGALSARRTTRATSNSKCGARTRRSGARVAESLCDQVVASRDIAQDELIGEYTGEVKLDHDVVSDYVAKFYIPHAAPVRRRARAASVVVIFFSSLTDRRDSRTR